MQRANRSAKSLLILGFQGPRFTAPWVRMRRARGLDPGMPFSTFVCQTWNSQPLTARLRSIGSVGIKEHEVPQRFS